MILSHKTLGLFVILSLVLMGLGQGAKADYNGVPLHGFADVVGGSSSNDTPEDQKLRGFGLGNIDFYLTPEFEGGIKSLLEIALEPDGGAGQIGIDMERVQLGYTFSDLLTVWVGRFHTPYGVWNTAYHHGAQLSTTVYRPRFLDFEDKGGVLPAHMVGMWARGGIRLAESLKLVYDFYSGNGPRIVADAALPGTLDPNTLRADHQGAMIGTNLALKFGGALDGLTVGAHGFATPVNAYNSSSYKDNATNGPVAKNDLLVMGGYVQFEGEKYEFVGEFYNFSSKNVTTAGGSQDPIASNCYYVHAAVAVGDYKPFLQYEKANFDSADTYFSNQKNGGKYERTSAGVKYDLTNTAALKFEYMHTNLPDLTGNASKYDIYATQYAVRF